MRKDIWLAALLAMTCSSAALAQHDRQQSDGGFHNVSTTQPDITGARVRAAEATVSLTHDIAVGNTHAAHQDQVNIDRANAQVASDLAGCPRCQ